MCPLARSNRSAKNVCVISIIVTEGKFVDVQREIFGTDFVERADNAAFHHAPETFDGVGVNRPSNVFTAPMIYCAARKLIVKSAVAAVFIRGNQADFIRYGFAHE